MRPQATEASACRAQAPSKTKDEKWRELSSIARQHRKAEHDRRSDSQWRKRTAAHALGLFKESRPDPETGWHFTDEAALDAYAPHGSDQIVNRYFTEAMEARELEAWALVEAAGLKGRAEYRDACRAYLRIVDAMERAEKRGLVVKPLMLGNLRKPSLHSLKLGAPRHRRAV